jgi:YesN/AraC family two-component response regulator
VDVRMPPGWDGVETTGRLWEIDPDLEIVICTAYSDYSFDEMVGRLGATDRLLILKKPFDVIEVLQLGNALTEKWWQTRLARDRLARIEQMAQQRILDLQSQVNQLAGLLPICAVCKKIRDDQNYWHEVETYIAKHTHSKFTHSICPECATRLYPELYSNEQR